MHVRRSFSIEAVGPNLCRSWAPLSLLLSWLVPQRSTPSFLLLPAILPWSQETLGRHGGCADLSKGSGLWWEFRQWDRRQGNIWDQVSQDIGGHLLLLWSRSAWSKGWAGACVPKDEVRCAGPPGSRGGPSVAGGTLLPAICGP